MVVGMTAILVPVHAVVGLALLTLQNAGSLAPILLAAGAGLVLTLPLMRRSARLAAMWFMALIVVDGGVLAWSSHGLASPVVVTFVLVPVAALVTGGSRVGLDVSLVSALQVLALWVAHHQGYEFPLEPMGPGYHATVAAISIVSVWLVFGFLVSYERAWRDAAERARHHASELVEVSEYKSRFLAHMSHELRTPLNAIIGYSEMLLEEVERPDVAADLARVHGSGVHLLALVDDLLRIEKARAGHLDLERESIALDELAGIIADEVRPFADQHGNRVTLRVPVGMTVRADRRALRQVLTNLLSNACKFTHQGRVTLSASMEDQRLLHLVVEDTGVGMSADDLAVVFEPFQQGYAGQHQGTGLGLAICKQLVEAMGGEVCATSRVGRGTRFEIELPQHEEDAPRPAAPAVSAEPPFTSGSMVR